MWRDPMDELIEELERIVPPEKPTFGSPWDGIEERQRRIQQILAEDDDEDSWPGVGRGEDEGAENLHPAAGDLPGHDDKPTPRS